jgi:hypothetical protein
MHLNTEINKASWKEDANLKGQTQLVDSLRQKIRGLEAIMYRQASDMAMEKENTRQDIQFLVKELSNLYDLFNHQSLELKSQKSIVENNHISAIKNIHRISETNAEVSMSRSQISQLQTQRARGNEENVALCMRLSELEKVVKVQSNNQAQQHSAGEEHYYSVTTQSTEGTSDPIGERVKSVHNQEHVDPVPVVNVNPAPVVGTSVEDDQAPVVIADSIPEIITSAEVAQARGVDWHLASGIHPARKWQIH